RDPAGARRPAAQLGPQRLDAGELERRRRRDHLARDRRHAGRRALPQGVHHAPPVPAAHAPARLIGGGLTGGAARAELATWAQVVSKHLKPKTRGYYEIWVDGERAVSAVPAADTGQPAATPA